MYYLVKREKIKRALVLKQEFKRKLLKSLWQNRQLTLALRYLIFLELVRLNVNGNRVKTHNRCIETGRGRSVFREFHLSRIRFRDRVRRGELPGIKQSSW